MEVSDKSNKRIVINDVLSEEDFKSIKDFIQYGNSKVIDLNNLLSWSYDTRVGPISYENNKHHSHAIFESKYEFQLVHVFLCVEEKFQEDCTIFNPLFSILQPELSIRLKVNLIPCADKVIESYFHTDTCISCSTTAIFYLNTCDGYTIFEDGVKVPNIENTMLLFPSYLKHTGTTTTNANVRATINYNYIPQITSPFAHISIPNELLKGE